jgi:hypothetical protein
LHRWRNCKIIFFPHDLTKNLTKEKCTRSMMLLVFWNLQLWMILWGNVFFSKANHFT